MKVHKLLVAFGVMGAASLTGQVLALRELMAALRGNELSLALILGVWLLLVGLFSWLGGRVARIVSDKIRAFSVALLALALIIPPTVLAPRLLLSLMGYAPGELIAADGMFLLVLVTLSVICPVIGLMFPLGVSLMEEIQAGAAGRVYALEALGSFIAGAAFTFLAAPRLSELQTASAASAMCLAASAALMAGKGPRVLGATAVVFALLMAPLFYFAPYLELMTYNTGSVGRVVQAVESKYGVITVNELSGQHAVYEGGVYSFSIPDRDIAELKAHLPMTVHGSPKDVLLVGGGGEGVLAEALKHPVDKVDYVELDPKLISVSMPYMTTEDRRSFYDRRVSVHYTDGRYFIKHSQARYDLVMVCLPEPTTASVNRYYTFEFFSEVRRILNHGGILSISLPSSPNYIGKRQLALNGSIYHTLRAVFPYVRITPEDINYFFAAKDKGAITFDTDILSRRFEARGINARSFNQYTLPYSLMPGRVAYVEGRIGSSSGLGINRDFRPAAYLYSLALWGEVSGLPVFNWVDALAGSPGRFFIRLSAFLLPVLIILYIVVIKGSRGRPASFAIATTGFASMVVEVAALLAYQSFYGYLYEMLGFLMALFMLGLFLGSRASAASWSRRPRPGRTLILLEACFAVLASGLMLMAFYPTAFSGTALSIVIFLAGGLTGAEYPAALAVSEAGVGAGKGVAGRIYGLDLIGSSLGAAVSGLFLIPLLGIAFTAAFVLLLKAVSIAFLLAEGGSAKTLPA